MEPVLPFFRELAYRWELFNFADLNRIDCPPSPSLSQYHMAIRPPITTLLRPPMIEAIREVHYTS